MALSVADFVAAYPEFAVAATDKPALVQAKLDAATRLVSQARFGDRYQDAVFVRCAHFLALSPSGTSARLNQWDGKTVYSAQWEEMLRAMPARMLTT